MLTCYDIRLLLPHGMILVLIYHQELFLSIVFYPHNAFLLQLFLTPSSRCRESYTNSPFRTCPYTLAAPDALCRIRRPDRVNLHLTDLLTLSTAYALMFIHFQPVDTDFIKQSVNRAKRTKDLTEKTVNQYTSDQGNHQNRHFQCKKRAYRLSERPMG